MTIFQQYLAEEIAVDHADGIIPRREALRRLGLLGFSVGAASALLAACGGDGAEPAATTAPRAAAPSTSSGGAAAVTAKPITFPGPSGSTLQGAWAPARRPRAGLLVIHENRGLNDHIRAVAGRFAASGYAARASPARAPPCSASTGSSTRG